MSTFATRFAAQAVPQLLGEFGDAVSYTPLDGSAVSLTASAGAQRHELDGRIRRFVREFRFSRDAAASYGGVLQPARGDTITLSSVAWTVEEVVSLTASMATVKAGTIDTEELTDVIEIQRNVPAKGTHGEQMFDWEYFRTGLACRIDTEEVETAEENESHFARKRVRIYLAVDREIASDDRVVDSDGIIYAIESIDLPEVDSSPMQIVAQQTQWPLASR